MRCALLTILMITETMASAWADQASWYGERHRGLPMASGRAFDPDRFTAASWFYELGTKLAVTHGERSVIVEVTDRGPAKRLVNRGRKIDLSRAAFAKLASPSVGLIDVTITKASDPASPARTTAQ
jgi:rare lipoprotein A